MDYSSRLDLSMKVVAVGDYSSGKSTLCYCLQNGKGPETACKPTIGIDFSVLEWNLDENDDRKVTKIHLFDTAGTEKYHSISQSYFLTADVFLVVADTTAVLNKEWEQRWIDKTQNTPVRHTGFPRRTILVASKVDQLLESDLNHNENIKMLRLLASSRNFYFVMTTTQRVPDMISDFYVIMAEIWASFAKHHKELMEKEEGDRRATVVLKPGNDEEDGWAIEHRCQC